MPSSTTDRRATGPAGSPTTITARPPAELVERTGLLVALGAEATGTRPAGVALAAGAASVSCSEEGLSPKLSGLSVDAVGTDTDADSDPELFASVPRSEAGLLVPGAADATAGNTEGLSSEPA